jgi:plasmid maintenance system antidote protein VapI
MARDTRIPSSRVSLIVNGRRSITADTAMRVAHHLGTSVQMWTNLQTAYDCRLTGFQRRLYTGGMEVHLSRDKQARLQEIGTRVGKNAEQMVEEAVDRMLEYDERFVAAVEEGRSSARRGELLEHNEVVERIDKLLRS